MAAVSNQAHPGTGPRTARGRVHELWATVVTALSGSGRRPAEHAPVVPAPEVVEPQRPAEPEQVGWPTWRNPR